MWFIELVAGCMCVRGCIVCCLCSWWLTWAWCIKWGRLVGIHRCQWQPGLAPRSSLVPNSTVNTMEMQPWRCLWPTWLLLAQIMMRQAPQCGYWLMPGRPHNIRLENDSYQTALQAGCKEAVWTKHIGLHNKYSAHKRVSRKHDHLDKDSHAGCVCSACVLITWQHIGGDPETP